MPNQMEKRCPPGPSPPNVEDFAAELISKLNEHVQKKAASENFKKCIDQVNDGDSSIASGGLNDRHRGRFHQVRNLITFTFLPSFNNFLLYFLVGYFCSNLKNRSNGCRVRSGVL